MSTIFIRFFTKDKTMIHQKTPTSQQKKQRNLTNRLDSHVCSKDVIEYLDQFTGNERHWRVAVINYLGKLQNKFPQVFPSQEGIAQGFVTRETVNRVLKELHEFGIIRKYRRRIIGQNKERTCLYVLSDWFNDYNNRQQYKHILSFMGEMPRSYIPNLFKYQPSKEPILWDHVTETINNSIDMRTSQHFVSEFAPKKTHKPPGLVQRLLFARELEHIMG